MAIEKPPQLATLLSPDQMRIIQRGTPQEKIELFRSLPSEKQDARHRIDAAGRPPADDATSCRRTCAASCEMANGPEQVITQDLMEGKLLRAVYSNRQLEEVLTDFWFNHFNVFLDKGADRYLTTVYERDVIRPHVLGKFHDLLLATAESPGDAVLSGQLAIVRAGQRAGPGQPRPERELRPRADGTAHARRGRRIHAEGRHRSGALLHRLDHQGRAVAAAATSISTR